MEFIIFTFELSLTFMYKIIPTQYFKLRHIIFHKLYTETIQRISYKILKNKYMYGALKY